MRAPPARVMAVAPEAGGEPRQANGGSTAQRHDRETLLMWPAGVSRGGEQHMLHEAGQERIHFESCGEEYHARSEEPERNPAGAGPGARRPCLRGVPHLAGLRQAEVTCQAQPAVPRAPSRNRSRRAMPSQY